MTRNRPNPHSDWCQQKAMGHSDAAKRISDTYNLHRLAIGLDAVGKWFAGALADGRGDNTLYDNKRECVRHQHHNEDFFTFIRIGPHTMTPCDAEVMLKTARSLSDVGLKLSDPDDARGGLDVIKRSTIEDQMAQSRGLNTNLVMPWEA